MSRIDDCIAEKCPDGVVFEQLANVGKWYGGGTPSKSRDDYWRTGTIPWVSPKDMGPPVITTTEDYITEAAVSGSSTKLVPPTSIAVVVRSSILDRILPTALVPIPVALNQDMKAVVPRDDILPGYIAHILRSRGPEILRVARKSGGSVASIESSRLFSYRIPVPPVEVQREIVRVLDTFSALEAELEAELEARLRQFQHYQSELLKSDDSIEHVSMGQVAYVGTGRTDRKDADADGEYPLYVRSQEVMRSNKWEFDETAIIIPGEGGIGEIFHFATGKYALHQRAYRVAPHDSKILPRFLYFYLREHFGAFVRMRAVTATVTSLRKPMLTDFPVPILSLEKQHRIVALLDQFDALVNDLSVGLPAELAARRTQYEYYRDRLLTFEERV